MVVASFKVKKKKLNKGLGQLINSKEMFDHGLPFQILSAIVGACAVLIMVPTGWLPSIVSKGLRLTSQSSRKGRKDTDLKALEADPNFQNWLDRFKKNIIGSSFGVDHVSAEEILVDDVDMFGSNFGFAKFTVLTKPFIPSIVFHRSPSVCVLFIVKTEGKSYGLLTIQARVPSGYRYLPELLAGMLDANTGKCRLVAVKELEEEAGIKVNSEQLIDLGNPEHFNKSDTTHICKSSEEAWDWFKRGDPVKTHEGYFNSPGGSTEATKFYMYEEEMDKVSFQKMVKKLETDELGVKSEGELIKLMLVPLEHMLDLAPDMKVGHALALRHRYLTQKTKKTR